MSDREPGCEGAARRRRERRLRQWARHEKLSVQMALAVYKHHSSRGLRTARAGEVEEHETNVGPRAQMPPPLGTRPAALREPVPQLGLEHAACPCSSGVPSLSPPSLADAAGDAVDSATLCFLTAAALKLEETVRKEEEEEDRKMLAVNHRVGEGLSLTDAEWSAWRKWATSSTSSAGKRRKRKKRRKRRLPRTSSKLHAWPRSSSTSTVACSWLVSWVLVLPTLCSRRSSAGLSFQASWLVWTVICAMLGLLVCDAPRVVFPSGVARPRMLCIMADMDQKDSTLRALVVNQGSGKCKVGFAGDSPPRAVFLTLSSGTRCAASRPAWITWWCCACCVQQQVPWVSKCRKLRFFCAVAAHQQGRLHHCHEAEAVSNGPDCLVDHRDPHLLLDMVIDVPVVGRAVAASARAVRTWNLYIISTCPLCLAALFGTRHLSSTKIRIFLEMTSRKCCHIRRMLWFAVDTSTCVSQQWHLEEFSHIPTCKWTPDPEVNSLWPPAGS